MLTKWKVDEECRKPAHRRRAYAVIHEPRRQTKLSVKLHYMLNEAQKTGWTISSLGNLTVAAFSFISSLTVLR
jgi:hypothetical protein